MARAKILRKPRVEKPRGKPPTAAKRLREDRTARLTAVVVKLADEILQLRNEDAAKATHQAILDRVVFDRFKALEQRSVGLGEHLNHLGVASQGTLQRLQALEIITAPIDEGVEATILDRLDTLDRRMSALEAAHQQATGAARALAALKCDGLGAPFQFALPEKPVPTRRFESLRWFFSSPLTYACLAVILTAAGVIVWRFIANED